MKKVRIGVIGAGGIATLHLNAYSNNPNAEVIALCDKNIEAANAKARQFNIPNTCENVDQLLERDDIDAVSITTPNWTHTELSMATLNAGKHVLCEKPPSLNSEGVARMVECAKKNHRLLMFGFEGKFAEKIRYTRELCLNGFFGELYYVKASYIRRCGNPGGWFATKELSGGGPMIDLGVHMLDLCLHLMNNPRPISVFASTYNKFGDRSNLKGIDWYKTRNYHESKFDVENLAVALIKFENDATLLIESSFDLHSKGKDEMVHLDIFGDKAGARIDPGYELFTEQNDYLVDLKPVLDDDTINWDECLNKEVDHFVDCIANGTACLFPAEDSIPVMKIIDATYQSSIEETSIRID